MSVVPNKLSIKCHDMILNPIEGVTYIAKPNNTCLVMVNTLNKSPSQIQRYLKDIRNGLIMDNPTSRFYIVGICHFDSLQTEQLKYISMLENNVCEVLSIEKISNVIDSVYYKWTIVPLHPDNHKLVDLTKDQLIVPLCHNCSTHRQEAPFNFDLEQMKKAVESPSVMLPKGLTSDQIEEFLMNMRPVKHFTNGERNE